MFKRWFAVLVLAVFAAIGSSSADAALIIQIDIGNDASNEFDNTPGVLGGADISTGGPFLAVASAFGLDVNVVVTTNESPLESRLTHVDIALSSPTTTATAVKVRVFWNEIDLPFGDPLTLTSRISTTVGLSDSILSTHTSFLTGSPVGGLTASLFGPFDSTSVSTSVPRGPGDVTPGTFSLEGITILNFDPGVVFINATATTIASGVPELASILAWASVLSVAGVIGIYRRSRRV